MFPARTVLSSLALSMVLALGCADPGDESELENLQSESGELFKATQVGDFDLLENGCGDGVFEVRSHANGKGTIVGKYTWETVECFDAAAGVFSGSVTIASKGGGTLVGTYAGVVTSIDGDVVNYTQAGTVSGGTGKFEGATGEFDSVGSANLATIVERQTHTGSIALPDDD